jgi:hypothetical protein
MTRFAVALLLACTIALLLGADATPAKRVGLIRVFARTKAELVDGRHHLVAKDVLDKRAKVIGSIGQVCVDIPTERQSCFGTIEMPLGKLVYSGTRRGPRFYVFAVTGGTGIYAGSSGTYASSTISRSGPRLEYVLISLVP